MSPHWSPERARTRERGRNRADVFPFPKATIPGSKMIVPCSRAVKSTAKNARELRSGRAVSLLFFPPQSFPRSHASYFRYAPTTWEPGISYFSIAQPAYYQNSTTAPPRVKTQDAQGPGWRLVCYEGSFYFPNKARRKVGDISLQANHSRKSASCFILFLQPMKW